MLTVTLVSSVPQSDARFSYIGAAFNSEATRIVPGINAAQFDSSKWVATTGGSSGRYAVKL